MHRIQEERNISPDPGGDGQPAAAAAAAAGGGSSGTHGFSDASPTNPAVTDTGTSDAGNAEVLSAVITRAFFFSALIPFTQLPKDLLYEISGERF